MGPGGASPWPRVRERDGAPVAEEGLANRTKLPTERTCAAGETSEPRPGDPEAKRRGRGERGEGGGERIPTQIAPVEEDVL